MRIKVKKLIFNYLVSEIEPKYVQNILDIANSGSDNKFRSAGNIIIFKEGENVRIKNKFPTLRNTTKFYLQARYEVKFLPYTYQRIDCIFPTKTRY